jgi:hypothetical protein
MRTPGVVNAPPLFPSSVFPDEMRRLQTLSTFSASKTLADRAKMRDDGGMIDNQDRKPGTLENLSGHERELVLAVIEHHPKLTVEEAIEALREAGMWAWSTIIENACRCRWAARAATGDGSIAFCAGAEDGR